LALLLRYQAKLEALYTALEERQKARLQALMEGTGGTVAERVEQVCNICFLYHGHKATSCPPLGACSIAALNASMQAKLCAPLLAL